MTIEQIKNVTGGLQESCFNWDVEFTKANSDQLPGAFEFINLTCEKCVLSNMPKNGIIKMYFYETTRNIIKSLLLELINMQEEINLNITEYTKGRDAIQSFNTYTGIEIKDFTHTLISDAPGHKKYEVTIKYEKLIEKKDE